MLDRPEAPIEDPALADALRIRGRRITLATVAITTLLTLAFWLLVP